MNCVYLWLWWLNKFTRYIHVRNVMIWHMSQVSHAKYCVNVKTMKKSTVYWMNIRKIYNTNDIIWKWRSQVCWQNWSSETVTNKRLIEAIRKRFVKRRKVFVVYLFSKLSSFIINISWWNIWNFCWCCRPLSV